MGAPEPAGLLGRGLEFVKKLAWVSVTAVRQYFADHCPQQAAAIAYRVLFSIAPLAIVLVSVFGLVLQDDSLRQDVVQRIVDALPFDAAGQEDVEDAITAIATPASAAALVSLLVFAWAATGMMAAVRQGLERAMSVSESRPMARGKLVDFALIVGAGALIVVTVAITLLGDLVERLSGDLTETIGLGTGTLGDAFLRAVALVVSAVVVLLLYRFVPARGLRVRDGVVGAVATAVMLQLISLASGWIYEKTDRLSVLYGSLTAALVFLYSMYLCASALLVGAEMAAAWTRPPTSGGESVLTQLRRAVAGIFVRQKPTPVALALPDLLADDRAPDP
jgi:membrane protein